jgi:DNA-binding NtrC family response regulator
VPALRDRKEDINLLFRKFVVDFAERYKTTPVQLDDEAKNMLINYTWPGNVRELKNIAEQLSVLSTNQIITAADLQRFLPEKNVNRLPVLASSQHLNGEFNNEREILYKLFFDMKKDVTELKKMFLEILKNPALANNAANFTAESLQNDYSISGNDYNAHALPNAQPSSLAVNTQGNHPVIISNKDEIQEHEEVEESLNIMDKEHELIIKALKKHRGKRKDAALDLGISERTLYRKLKEYDINE